MTKRKRIITYTLRSLGIWAVVFVFSLFLEKINVGKESILMVYIVGVLLITSCTDGYIYGAGAAVISALDFNFFFMVPVRTLAIINHNDVILIGFFLITALIASSLTVRFRLQVKIAEDTKAQMEKERLKSSLLRSISHDFRTPLTGIMGDCGLLVDGDDLDRDSRRKLAIDIQEQAVWLMKLVENILNMTRIESGQFRIKKQPEVVDDIIYEAASHVIGLREKRKFRISLPEELLVAQMDGKMMVQVLVNLLDNAVKNTVEGDSVTVRVIFKTGKVYIYVEDEGSGIEEEIKEHIFDEFVSRADGRKDGHRGIGLGLPICRAVVEAHGGEIYAENRKEGGACFVFWLKAEQVETDG